MWTIFPCLGKRIGYKVTAAGVRTRSSAGCIDSSTTEFDDFRYLEDIEVEEEIGCCCNASVLHLYFDKNGQSSHREIRHKDAATVARDIRFVTLDAQSRESLCYN